MRKAGLEPAWLAPPPPQDGVSANSTTSAFRPGPQPPHQVAVGGVTRCSQSSQVGRLERLRLRLRRRCRRILNRRSRCRRSGLGWGCLLLDRLGAFHHRTPLVASRKQRERKGGQHEHNGRACSQFGKKCCRAASSKSRLGPATAKCASQIGSLSRLQENNQNQNQTDQDMNNG